jgi:hypothetical protein
VTTVEGLAELHRIDKILMERRANSGYKGYDRYVAIAGMNGVPNMSA